MTDTVSLGAIVISMMVGAAGLATYLYGVRWRTAAQVFESNATAWEKAAHRLEERITTLEEERSRDRETITRLTSRVAELEALPDISAVAHLLADHDDRTSRAMREHDEHAEIRANKIVAAIHELKESPSWQP